MSNSPIGSAGNSPLSMLRDNLQSSGLSAKSAAQTVDRIADTVKGAAAGSGARLDRTTIRDAIDVRLDADVGNGSLSASDAALIRKSLDEFDKRMTQGSGGRPPGGMPPGGMPPGGAPPGGAPHGAAGPGGAPPGGVPHGGASAGKSGSGGASSGGGETGTGDGSDSVGVSALKIETSRTSSTAGGVTTTTITYSDGSKSNKTTYGEAASDAGAGGKARSGTDEIVGIMKELSPENSGKAASYVRKLSASDLIDVRT